MSKEAHPNINAAGLTADVINSIFKYARGEMQGKKALTPRVLELVTSFAVIISETLDLEAKGAYKDYKSDYLDDISPEVKRAVSELG